MLDGRVWKLSVKNLLTSNLRPSEDNHSGFIKLFIGSFHINNPVNCNKDIKNLLNLVIM